MGFKVIDHKKITHQIAQQIIQLIKEGEFTVGDRLPAERELCEKMKVSRGSIREALSALQAAGIVETKTGSGTFVKQVPVSKRDELKAIAEALNDVDPLDLIEVRESLESKAAYLAAQRASKPEIEKMKESLDQMEKLLNQNENPNPGDMKFHKEIIKASKNTVLIMLMERIYSIMQQYYWQELMKELSYKKNIQPEFRTEYLKQHKEIYRSILEQNPSKASRLMSEHIHYVYRKLLDNH